MFLSLLPAGADDTATIAELETAVIEINEAFSKRDAETIRRLATPDHFAVTTQFRKPLTLAEQLDTLGQYKREPFDFTDIEVRLLGDDAALVTYENSYRPGGYYRDEPLAARVFVSQVWLLQDGIWRQLSYQETPITMP
jgi:hypothetical protein